MVTRIGNGSISEAHTGVIPASSPPKGNPPEPSNRLPRVKGLFVMGRYLAILVFLAVPQNADLLIRAGLLNVPLHDDIAEFSSSSMVQQMRSVCSQAMSVEPEPPKGSRTTLFAIELF